MSDLIDRQAAIDEIEERKNANGYCNVAVISELNRLEGYIMQLPSAQTEHATCYLDSPCEYQNINIALPTAESEVIRCKECIYYDPEHIENNGIRYEYKDMPKEAFDELGTGLVNIEYGINVGGRCCRDYNVGYSEDKRVFVPETNYCGRAERRTDE